MKKKKVRFFGIRFDFVESFGQKKTPSDVSLKHVNTKILYDESPITDAAVVLGVNIP